MSVHANRNPQPDNSTLDTGKVIFIELTDNALSLKDRDFLLHVPKHLAAASRHRDSDKADQTVFQPFDLIGYASGMMVDRIGELFGLTGILRYCGNPPGNFSSTVGGCRGATAYRFGGASLVGNRADDGFSDGVDTLNNLLHIDKMSGHQRRGTSNGVDLTCDPLLIWLPISPMSLPTPRSPRRRN
jgi:hypothetical protein